MPCEGAHLSPDWQCQSDGDNSAASMLPGNGVLAAHLPGFGPQPGQIPGAASHRRRQSQRSKGKTGKLMDHAWTMLRRKACVVRGRAGAGLLR